MRLILLILLTVVTACSDKVKSSLPNIASSQMKDTIAEGTPDFQMGWRDGCEVGTSAGGNTFYKSIFRSNRVDGYKYTESKDYKAAWDTAWWYCYRYQFVKNKSGQWNSIFGGYK